MIYVIHLPYFPPKCIVTSPCSTVSLCFASLCHGFWLSSNLLSCVALLPYNSLLSSLHDFPSFQSLVNIWPSWDGSLICLHDFICLKLPISSCSFFILDWIAPFSLAVATPSIPQMTIRSVRGLTLFS